MSANYIAYCRVSSKKQEKKENSTPTQKRIIKEYATRKGLKITKWFVETGSGFKGERKKFMEAVKMLEEDKADGLIFHKVDRSARNMQDFARIDALFDRKSFTVIEGEFDTSTSYGRMQFRLFCAMAVWYSENLREEVIIKTEKMLRDGRYPSRAPIGYDNVGHGNVQPSPAFPLVKELFEKYDSGKFSFATLAREMRRRGLKNKVGKPIAKKDVEKILSNPFYHGVVRWGLKNGVGNEKYYAGAHEPAITKALFDRIQQRKSSRCIRAGTLHNFPYNRKIVYENSVFLIAQRQKGRNYYAPSNFKGEVKFICDGEVRKTIREDFLDKKFANFFKELKLKIPPEFFDQLKKCVSENSASHIAEQKKIRRQILLEIEALDLQIQNAEKKWLLEKISDENFEKIKSRIEDEKKNLVETLSQKSILEDRAFWKTGQNFCQIPKLLSREFENLNPDEKRDALELFFSSIKVNGGMLSFDLEESIRIILDLSKCLALEPQSTAPQSQKSVFLGGKMNNGEREGT